MPLSDSSTSPMTTLSVAPAMQRATSPSYDASIQVSASMCDAGNSSPVAATQTACTAFTTVASCASQVSAVWSSPSSPPRLITVSSANEAPPYTTAAAPAAAAALASTETDTPPLLITMLLLIE